MNNYNGVDWYYEQDTWHKEIFSHGPSLFCTNSEDYLITDAAFLFLYNYDTNAIFKL